MYAARNALSRLRAHGTPHQSGNMPALLLTRHLLCSAVVLRATFISSVMTIAALFVKVQEVFD